MNPTVQIIVGYTLIALCAIGAFAGSVMVKNGLERKNKQVAIQPTKDNQEELQNNIKIAKIQINRLIEDAHPWLEEKIEQNKTKTNEVMNYFNSRGAFHGGRHVAEHIKRVNNFIKSINDYIRNMDRKIEDLLISAKEEKFENAKWLKDEYQKYLKFITFFERAKETIKKQNNELCSRFTDKLSFDNILKDNPYRE